MDTACAALPTPGDAGRRRSSLHVVMAALAADEAAGDGGGGEGGEEPVKLHTGDGDNEGKKLAPPQSEDKGGSSRAPSDTPASKPAARAPLPPLRGRPPLGTLPKGCVAAAKRLQEQAKLLAAGPVYGRYDPPIYFSRGAVKSMNDAAATPHAAKPAAARLQPQPPTQPASPKRASPVPAADTRQRFAALLGSVHKFHTKKAQPAEGAQKRRSKREASLKAKPRRVQHKAEWGSHTGPASQTKQLLAVEPRYVAAKALAELKQMNATDARSLRPLPPPQARKLPSQRQRATPRKEQDACIVLPPVRRLHTGASPCGSEDSRRAAAAAGAQPRPMRPSPSSPSSASEASSARSSSVAPRRSAGPKGGAKSPVSDESSSYCEQPAPLASPVSTAATRSAAASPARSPSPALRSVKSPAARSSAAPASPTPASPAPPSPSSTCTSGRSIPDTLEGSTAAGTPAHPPAQQTPAAAPQPPPAAAQASVDVDDGSASEATTTCTPLPKDDAESSRSSSLSGSSRSASYRDAQSPPPQTEEAAGYSSDDGSYSDGG